MNDTPQPVAGPSADEKRAALARLLKEKAIETTSFYPLSHGQQALWFLQRLAPNSAAYNVMYAWRICSGCDVSVLRRAFQSLVDRHPALRTTFTTRNGEPIQQIHRRQEVCFEVTDASAWSQQELGHHLAKVAYSPFDLEQGPVLRINMFTRSGQAPVLLLTAHHIIVDGWSLQVLLEELGQLYSAIRDDVQLSLALLEMQYTDYVRWQTRLLASPEGEQLWRYWQQQLAGELPVLNLPTDRPRPPVQTDRGASHAFPLPEELVKDLKSLARGEGMTLYVVLLAAFQVLLHRHTGQTDILVGSPAAGRSRPEFMRTVGYFVNMFVLRGDLGGNPVFKAFLHQVRRTVLSALEHQDYAFPLLVDRLQPSRDPSHSPLFQAVFVLQSALRQQMHRAGQPGEQAGVSPLGVFSPGEMGTRLSVGELVFEPFPLEQRVAPFDLELEMIEAGESLSGCFQYNTDLFDAATIARMEFFLFDDLDLADHLREEYTFPGLLIRYA